MQLPNVQPNLMAVLTEFRDLRGFDPMQTTWQEHLQGTSLDQDQVDDMMTSENSKCCDAGISNQGFCSACGEHA